MMTPIKYLNGLGVVADKKRNIRSGAEYDKYFPRPSFSDPYLSYAGTVHDTLSFMGDIIKKTLSDTKRIAPILRGATLQQTCNNIFNFVFNHIQYKPDNPKEEELRRPSRTWHDRKTGADCDCYSIFIGSILSNLKIPFALRMVKIKNRSYFQHVYVVVPKDGKQFSLSSRYSYFVIDPVLNTFDEEHPFTGKKDNFMQPIKYLNGYANGLNGFANAPKNNDFDLLDGIFGNLPDLILPTNNDETMDGLGKIPFGKIFGAIGRGIKKFGGKIVGGIRKMRLNRLARLKARRSRLKLPKFKFDSNLIKDVGGGFGNKTITGQTPHKFGGEARNLIGANSKFAPNVTANMPRTKRRLFGGGLFNGGIRRFLRDNSSSLINAGTNIAISRITGQPIGLQNFTGNYIPPYGMNPMADPNNPMNPMNPMNPANMMNPMNPQSPSSYWLNKGVDAQIEANKGVSNNEAMRIARLTAEAEKGKLLLQMQQTKNQSGLGLPNISPQVLLMGGATIAFLFAMMNMTKRN